MKTSPMSAAGKKYRSLIDGDGECNDSCNDSCSVMRWKNSCKAIDNTVTTITMLIDIRDTWS